MLLTCKKLGVHKLIGYMLTRNLYSKLHSLFSNRQHVSYSECLEVRENIIRTVLCCVLQLCSHKHTHKTGFSR